MRQLTSTQSRSTAWFLLRIIIVKEILIKTRLAKDSWGPEHEGQESRKSSSSETQGQIVGARESLNGRENIYGTKKSKEGREEPLGSSRRSLPPLSAPGSPRMGSPRF